MTTEDDEKE